MERLDAESLDGFPMLEGVGLTARRELLAAAERRSLEPGEVIIEQGARHACMFFVIEGELAVHLGTPTADPVAFIGPGETVGEMSVLDGTEASAFVTAKTEASLLEISEDDFWQLT